MSAVQFAELLQRAAGGGGRDDYRAISWKWEAHSIISLSSVALAAAEIMSSMRSSPVIFSWNSLFCDYIVFLCLRTSRTVGSISCYAKRRFPQS